MKIIFLGDIVGKAGRHGVRAVVPKLLGREKADFVIANCENAAGGIGVDGKTASELLEAGVDLLTSGNHVWHKKEMLQFAQHNDRLLRPANFPPGQPGKGWAIKETAAGIPLAVINLIGRVFMGSWDCPFRIVDAVLAQMVSKVRVIVVDMHAEATSEKVAMGWFLNGRVSAVLGSHTHVQTADEIILPGGTAYITDVGMCGPTDSVIGMKKDQVIHRFLTQLPVRFDVGGGDAVVQGAIVDIDETNGRAHSIRRVREFVAV